MQRSLQLSLRLSCRKICRPRLYSSQAAAVLHPTPFPRNEPVASGSNAKSIAFPEDSSDSLSGQVEAKIPAAKPKRKRKIRLEELDSDHPSRSEQNKVDTYLASLRAGGIEPTLDDLERLRPKKKPSSNSPKYADVYNELVDRLCRTFSKDQLREFGEQLQFDGIWTRSGRRKVEFAESILEKAWGWENLKEIERRKRDMSEVLVKSFSVSPSELFLLLGKDGSELLQISVDYNVHISVKANPLSIRIEGLRGSLKDLEKMLSERRKAIIEETTELPMKAPLSQELVQQLSRLANAFIENLGNKGKIRICANDNRHLTGAKRLAVRASVLAHHEAHIPFLVFLPPDPPSISPTNYSHTYSLYPFLPHRSLPWTIKSGGTFRCRRVSEWLGEPLGEDVLHSGGLAGGKGKFLTETGDSVSLEDLMRKAFPQTNSVGLTASTGHILFSDSSRKTQTSILPPFPGHWQFPKFMTWLQEGNAQRCFIPSLPAPLHNTSPLHEKIVHRITYRRLQARDEASEPSLHFPEPSKMLKYEVVLTERVVLPKPKLNSDDEYAGTTFTAQPNEDLDALLIEDNSDSLSFEEESPYAPESPSEPSNAPTKLDLSSATTETIAILESSANEVDEDDVPHVEETMSQPEFDVLGEPSFQESLEMDILLSLPDRPLDASLKIISLQEGSVGMDERVMNYFETIKEFLNSPEMDHPEPPLFLEREGETYVLQANESIRRSEEKIISYVRKPIDWDSADGRNVDEHILRTTSESVLDLDANEKSVKCELPYQASSGKLHEFLKDLDGITTINYNQNSKTNKVIAIQDNIPDEGLLEP